MFSWEMSLAVWTFAKGFKQSPVISGSSGSGCRLNR